MPSPSPLQPPSPIHRRVALRALSDISNTYQNQSHLSGSSAAQPAAGLLSVTRPELHSPFKVPALPARRVLGELSVNVLHDVRRSASTPDSNIRGQHQAGYDRCITCGHAPLGVSRTTNNVTPPQSPVLASSISPMSPQSPISPTHVKIYAPKRNSPSAESFVGLSQHQVQHRKQLAQQREDTRAHRVQHALLESRRISVGLQDAVALLHYKVCSSFVAEPDAPIVTLERSRSGAVDQNANDEKQQHQQEVEISRSSSLTGSDGLAHHRRMSLDQRTLSPAVVSACTGLILLIDVTRMIDDLHFCMGRCNTCSRTVEWRTNDPARGCSACAHVPASAVFVQ
jgi:hypothetical protein